MDISASVLAFPSRETPQHSLPHPNAFVHPPLFRSDDYRERLADTSDDRRLYRVCAGMELLTTGRGSMKFHRILIPVQSAYILLTALWGLLHVESFMAVTGPKTDVWLVKTVSALLVPIAICLGTFHFIRTELRPAVVLGSLTAIAFIGIDFYYSLTHVISDVYLADGFLQVVFLILWIRVIAKKEISTRSIN